MSNNSLKKSLKPQNCHDIHVQALRHNLDKVSLLLKPSEWSGHLQI